MKEEMEMKKDEDHQEWIGDDLVQLMLNKWENTN